MAERQITTTSSCFKIMRKSKAIRLTSAVSAAFSARPKIVRSLLQYLASVSVLATLCSLVGCDDNSSHTIACNEAHRPSANCTCNTTTGFWENCGAEIDCDAATKTDDSCTCNKTTGHWENCGDFVDCTLHPEDDACKVAPDCTESQNACTGLTRNYCDGGILKRESCPYACEPGGCKSCEDQNGAEKCENDGTNDVHSYCTDTEFLTETCPYGCEGNHCRACVVGQKRCGYEGALQECKEDDGKAKWVSTTCQKGCVNDRCLECTPEDVAKGYICEGGYRRHCGGTEPELKWYYDKQCPYGCFDGEECKKYSTVGRFCSEDGSKVLEYSADNQVREVETCMNSGCHSGSCDDQNGNHKLDIYDGDWKNAQSCTKNSQCKETEFCDLLINHGTCMPKCDGDEQCVEGYLCRRDGRCSYKAFTATVSVIADHPSESYFAILGYRDGTPAQCDFTIDWGDGSAPEEFHSCKDGIWKEGNLSKVSRLNHAYKAGDYQISITGKLNQLVLLNLSDYYWLSIDSFGPVGVGDYFLASSRFNTTLPPDDVPDASLLKSTQFMFQDNLYFNDPLIANWDMSNVENMHDMFSDSMFNQPIGNWDTSKVKDMGNMFHNDIEFNQSLESWDVGNVSNMSGMFAGTSFNQPLNAWNVSKVTDMSRMFYQAESFNQDLKDWDVSNVTNMEEMFLNAKAFAGRSNSTTKGIGAWNVGKVTNMKGMFSGATKFNAPIGNWNVSNVTDMSYMFASSKFNQELNTWNTASVENMESMFTEDTAFNQDLSDWNVASVQSMAKMFYKASSYSRAENKWRPRYITQSKDCNRLAEIFTGTKVPCTKIVPMLRLWQLLSVCPSIKLRSDCE